MTGHSERARRALAHLPEADPALAALALWCVHRDGPGAGAARTEGETILYGAAFPTLPLHEQVGLAGHHILHVALRHGARMAAMDARLGERFDGRVYNLAADGIVNTALASAGHALPRPAVTLEALLERTGLPVAGPAAALSAWDVDRLYLGLMHAGDGARTRLSDYADRQDFTEDLASVEAGDREDSRAADWQGRMARALAAGRKAGRGLGLHASTLGDLPVPRVPWERRLRGLVETAVGTMPRRSYRRPASAWVAREAEARRGGGPAPVFEPGRSRDARRPRIAVGLDTSGSIAPDMLRRLAAEVDAIARRTGAETHLLAFDETVHRQVEVGPGGLGAALAAAPLRQGGGTDFADVIARAGGLGASVAVILTDLDGAPGPRAAFPVIWAVPAPGAARNPGFGHVLALEG